MSEGKIVARRREDRPEVLYLVLSNPRALNALTEEMQILRSAYGALVAGRSVCTGYARTFQALCDGLGLDCWTVNGYQDGAGHAWNMVRLDGEILYVDCTFGDTGGRPERYFLFDQETLEARRYEMDEGFVVPW